MRYRTTAAVALPRPSAATKLARRLIEMQVEQTDREIDALVYDLYGLTPEEIAVVEAAVGK